MGISKNNQRITITLDKSLKKEAEKQAKIEMRSLSNLISKVLFEYLNNQKKIKIMLRNRYLLTFKNV